jgi:hypothetical protein
MILCIVVAQQTSRLASTGGGIMEIMRKEVRDLISLNEKIQSAILRGERMTDTEREIIHMCVNELLASINNIDQALPNGHDGIALDTAGTDPNRAL